MTDRDHFAAAALTGLLASTPYAQARAYAEYYADESYRMADAMLRERTQNNASPIVPSRATAGDVASPSGSSGGPINRSAERQSPASNRRAAQPLDDTRPDTKGEATGGRGRFISERDERNDSGSDFAVAAEPSSGG